MIDRHTTQSNGSIRQRVLAARERQLARFDGSGLTCNADTPALAAHTLSAALRRRRAWRGASVSPAHIREYCELDETSKALMRSAMNQLGMSARPFHRVLKLGRTIADLAEAIHLRSTEKAGVIKNARRVCRAFCCTRYLNMVRLWPAATPTTPALR